MVNTVVVVLQVRCLLELLDSSLVDFLGVAFAFEAETEASLAVVGVSGAEENPEIVLAECVLDVLH